jgi:DnaJ-class molecular chaperone
MTFGERMKDLLNQGVTASKDFAVKAGTKAQELGEIGVLMLEIKQLEGQAQKLIARLGAEVYESFAERGQDIVSKSDAPVSAMLAGIARIKETIEGKEAELKIKKQ